MEARKSQIATTVEQSKRLMEAGLEPESADMRWEQILGLIPRLCYQPDATMPLIAPKVIPAWSLSRLIDLIAETGIPMNYGPMKDSADVLECAVRLLEYELEDADH